MKKILLFALPMLAMCIVSCNRVEIDATAGTEDTPQSVGETVNVSFAFNGDITIEESPLSKVAGEETESTDLYGINVYYDKERDGNINDVYGYGLFDNISDMNISLLTGYKYKFVCSLVKDGKNKIGYNNYKFYYDSNSYTTQEGYCFPFCKSDYKYSYDSNAPTQIQNKFVLGDGYYLTGLESGATHHYNYYGNYSYRYNSYTEYPGTDRYYGETTDYIPTEGGIVSIEMKRCVFGIKLNIDGITDGTLKVTFGDYTSSSSNNYITIGGLTQENPSYTGIYTFNSVSYCWEKDTYSRTMTMKTTWTRGNNVVQTLESKEIEFKRNVQTTINIKLNGASDENGFNLDLESDEMTEENADFEFDAGDMEDTPVEPTE